MEKTANPSAHETQETVGAVVAKDYRTAAVLEKHGIDFCCGGNVALDKACRDRGIDPEALRKELEEAVAGPLQRSENYDAWDLSFLADYIVNTHHVYLRENIPAIRGYAQKIAQVHGANHPELKEIAGIFEKMAADMEAHLQKEEEQLFPALKELLALNKAGNAAGIEDRERLKKVLTELDHEHDEVGAAIHEIRRLASDYALPPDACNTFKVAYEKLNEFEDDLHKHVHLENNILFPKASRL